MTFRRYVVERADDGWRIDYHGHKAGSFPTEEVALSTAERLAGEAARLGDRAEVVGPDGAVKAPAGRRARPH